MKVKHSLIAKDIRLTGRIYKILFSKVPGDLKRKPPKKQAAEKPSTSKKNTRYIQRRDKSYLRLLILKPEEAGKKVPGILWIHGGGYATGMPEMAYISMPRLMGKARDCVLVCPDYTLSVKKPYPAALDDCYLALLWMKENAEELGIRDDQLFVGGESAGGGLTVAVCLRARDSGEVNIACQMPLYPMLDDRMNTESMKDNDAPVWGEKQNAKAWALYLDGTDRENPPKYASPGRETDYSGLPPAITFVGSIEPFRDETAAYVKNLQKTGIHTDFRIFEGCYHAFDMMAPRSQSAKAAKAFFMDCFLRAYENCFAPQE